MFNTTNNTNKTVLNTPANGIIQKSNEKSFFLRMHQNSKLADRLFVKNPTYNDKYVVVLQVLLTHDDWFLVEFVEKEHL